MAERLVSTIKLDEGTRKRIAKELRLQRRLQVVPEEIQIVRVSHKDLGIEPDIFGQFRANAFIIVDA